jgi:hypothetical protein
MATTLAEPPTTSTADSPVLTNPIEESASTDLTTTTPSDVPVKKTKKIIRVKKKRPARVQVDPATFKPPAPTASGTIYNIWYNKWSGGDSDQYAQHAALSRCNIEKDSGYTQADGTPGAFFCLKFARGICPRGRECEYLHRLPGLQDIFNPNVDCFGRDKHADYRDDMGGVGSFLRQNRTLYIGRIHVTDDIEELVARHFAEWGPIERTRVLNMRGVGFVTYARLANAEFAKEAMAHQALDNAEVLNVRWATQDPNVGAQKREARMIEEQAAEAIRKALPPEYVAELEGRDPEARKRRKVEGSFGLEGYDAPEDVWYAKQKADWIAEQRGIEPSLHEEQAYLEASQEQMMLENSHIQEEEEVEEEGGIFSGSTLKALKNHKTVSGRIASKSAATGPLVGYGTDSEDEED